VPIIGKAIKAIQITFFSSEKMVVFQFSPKLNYALDQANLFFWCSFAKIGFLIIFYVSNVDSGLF